MRKCTQYSAEFKERLLAKVFSTHAPSPVELARKAGIPYATLNTWIYKAKNKHMIKPKTISKPPKKPGSAESKLQAMFDTFEMKEEERGAYCREHGLYTHELDDWKKQVLALFSKEKDTTAKEQRTEVRQLSAENKQLKHELHRKEKALVEASALLLLKKKANLIWGDNEDD